MNERMNGKEFLNKLAREKMPNIDQVRDQIHAHEEMQVALAASVPRRSFFKRLQWRTAVLITAASLIFAGAVTAVGVVMHDRVEHVDVGSPTKIVLLPYDCPEAREYAGNNIRRFAFIYISSNSDRNRNSLGLIANSHNVRLLNEELAAQLYLADGSPFPYPFMVSIGNGFYRGHARGHVLFDASGNEIYEMNVMWQGDELYQLSIQTAPQDDRFVQENRDASFADAVAVLGVAFTLPDVDAEQFQPPTFHTIGADGFGFVQVRFSERNSIDDAPSSRDIAINIQPQRADGEEPSARIMLGAAEILEIAGTTVYRIVDDRRIRLYIWAHNGLAFELIPPVTGSFGRGLQHLFTDEQIYELITEMLH